jgi:hypothetical protein
MAKDRTGVQIAFFSVNDEFYSRSVSVEEVETGLMCVLNLNIKREDLPIFKLGYCDKRNYIEKFWDYFTIGNAYDVTCHVGLFITAFRVIGYDVNIFCEHLVTRKNDRERKRELGYVYSDEDA